MKTKLLRIVLLAAFAVSLLAPTTNAQAADTGCSWTGSVDANWSTPGNWGAGCTGLGGIPGTGDTLTFPLGASNATMTHDLPAITLQSLIFSGALDYTLNGTNAITLTGGIDVQAGNQTINAPLTVAGAGVTFHTANGAMLTLGGALDLDAYNVTFTVDSATDVIGINLHGAINTSGLAKISKNGAGELKIIGDHNSKNFDIDINAGSISTDPSTPTYLPQYKTITLASGANLYLKNFGIIGSISGSGNIHATHAFQIRQGKNTTFTGDLFGNNQMIIVCNGTAVLTIDRSGGSLSYAGEINVNSVGKLLLANTTATASIPGFWASLGRLELNNSHVGAIRVGHSFGGFNYNGALILSGTNASTATSITLKNASSIETVINSATDYGHITVTSPVDLGAGAPTFALQGSYTPSSGDIFTVIQNTNSGTATTSNAAFSNLPQGGVLPFNTINMMADYLAAGNTAFTLTATTPDVTPPTVQSSVRPLSNPTSSTIVTFIVTFTENVTGVDTADFSLATTGISGASVGSVIPTSASVYIVNVFTGTGNGTLRLDVPVGATISDVAGNPLAGLPYTSGETYTVQKDIVAPTVLSIVRANPNPTALASVNFTVTFSESVSGVDAADFALTASGVSGATVSGVSGSGNVYTLTVSTGSGNGTLRLDVPVGATISDIVGNPLAGLPYTSGETYTINKTQTATFRSAGAEDGWILESTETSAKGGSINSSATTFRLGDFTGDKQYRAILHFDTSALPDTAVITKVTFKIKQSGAPVGTNPFTILNALKVDIRKPRFGSSAALVNSDFQAAASQANIGSIPNTPVDNWYTKIWTSGAFFTFVNKTGSTQFRLYFAKGDNDNNAADYMKFFSGDAPLGSRPQLIVEYYVP
ncbi:MAG: hypothetical protein HY867_08680 [Chloroflexi bacterium]|nr:hypothetical protein [Chloroflexota bacterium]